jgi:hypothetical protein
MDSPINIYGLGSYCPPREGLSFVANAFKPSANYLTVIYKKSLQQPAFRLIRYIKPEKAGKN